MQDVELTWERPLDGVEITMHTDIEGFLAMPRSERTTPVMYTVRNLEHPVVTDFLNAKHDADLADFLATHGMLRAKPREKVKTIRQAQARLTDLIMAQPRPDLIAEINGRLETVQFKPAFDYSGPRQSLRMVLHPADLLGLMEWECAFTHAVGAKARTCSHCGRYFLTGPETGRRSHAEYDSDNCRIAASRARSSKED
ncbi:hypothetical protein SAMN05428967_3362 [Phyllobacterium sp. YR620]|uniref:hypothetical protein n=1 Tax=Phyllobacterium sp. YR620 TaxID=1881066 RepID=UPI000886D423|nr:hypothetical protein [Phyllobacterium sp. YR620]SDP77271.1 hypothetical protein SAMN05428967_3362 [Phyllobacterium sp. YR620]